MPLLKYFAVVGFVLLGLLVVANALMSSPKKPVFASKFDSSTPEWLVTTDRLARPAPEPPHIATVPLEPVATAAAPQAAPAASVEKAEIKKPKKTRVARRQPKTESADNGWGNDSWNNSWNGDTWNHGSWNHDSWNHDSRSYDSWNDNSTRHRARGSRAAARNGGAHQRSSSSQDSWDAFAYAPRYRSDRW
jgi:hypothetical protein